MHVSFRVDPEDRDGHTLLRAWPTLAGVACGAKRAGLDVAVVQAAGHDERVYRDGVRFDLVHDVRAIPVALPFGLRFARRPARILEAVAALEPDVVHVHGFHYPLAVHQLAGHLGGSALVLQDHASAVPPPARRRVWRWVSKRVAGVLFTTKEQGQSFVDAGVLRQDTPVYDVLEGSSDFAPGDRDAARQRTGVSGSPALLWTGHLDGNKDPLTVLEALSMSLPALPDARVWCCFRQAPLLDEVRARLATDTRLSQQVTLLGARPHDQLEQYFRAADFFVQMSHREGSGYSVIEALACGTPPLVSDIAPFRRIVGDAGALVPAGDAAGLSRAMLAWSARDRAADRHAARRRFDEQLSFDAIGRELRRIYEGLGSAR